MPNNLSKQIQLLNVKDYIVLDNSRTPLEIPLNQPAHFRGIVLIICKQGKVRLNIDMRECLLEENMICTLLPGSIVFCTEVSDDLLFFSLFFTIDFVSEFPPVKSFSFLEKIKQFPVQTITPQDAQCFISYYRLIERKCLSRDQHFSEKTAKGLVYSLYSEIASIYYLQQMTEREDQSTSRQNELLNQLFPLLREYSSQRRDVAFYADKMCLTPKYLSTRIKKVSGKSIFEWINTAAIIHAKVLLKTNGYSISQISEMLNFPNPSFFSRFFKKHTGMTPNEYRKAN